MSWTEIANQISNKVMGLVFMGGSLYVFIRILQFRQQWLASLDWPQTTGMVVRRWTVMSQSNEGGAFYFPHVSYRYEVDGVEHTSEIWGYMGQSGQWTEEEADALFPDHRQGDKVPVYYDPKNPAAAVLMHDEGTRSHLLLMGVTLVLFIAGLVVFLL